MTTPTASAPREATTVTRPRGGIGDSLRAAGRAAPVVGLLFGLADAIVAARVGTAEIGTLGLAGCAAAAVLEYTALAIVGLALAAVVLHPWLARRERGARAKALLAIGIAVGSFAEVYWWTRPYVFPGRSSLAPERLASGAAMLGVSALLAVGVAGAIARLPRAVQRALAVAIGATLVAGAAFLLLQPSDSAKGAIGDRNRSMPNVVLVIVDAMRQDVLGCYGNDVVRTPAIDRLAAAGVVFENAFVQAPFTWTSFGSMLTGKYPRRHGLVKMASGVALSADNVTLPWHLKTGTRLDGTRMADEDWLGATFHTGTLSTGSQLMRGFDVYYEAMAGHDLVVLERPWSVFRSDLLLHLFASKIAQRFGTGDLPTRAREWIAAHADRRFVAMIHLYSTHTPYDPPADLAALYVDPAYDGPIRAFYAQSREAIERDQYVPTAADVAQIRALYHGGVGAADREIGRIVDELERLGIADDTLVIVTADHGESLGEQGLWEHNHMVETNLRIPLVMSWPKGLARGVRVSALVDEIDVLPTVSELAGLRLPRGEGERAIVDGTSLLPLVRGEVASIREFSFAENGRHLSIRDLRSSLVVARELLEQGDAESAWTRGLAGTLEKPRYFDLTTDPGEEREALDRNRDAAKRLFDALVAWNRTMPIPVHDVVRSDRDLEAELERLGYAGGVGADDGRETRAPEPAKNGAPERP